MTAGGDFMAAEQTYPKVFGITITPMVTGVLLAIAGLGAGFWLFTNMVQPAMDENAQLSAEVAEKEGQLMNQAELQQRIEAARKRLKEAEQLRADVLSLFASKDNVDTLLLDVNERIRSVNGGGGADDLATLTKFDLNTEKSGVINDSSFGSQVNGRLERRAFTVELKGSFAQTQSILRNVERLQTLLAVTNLKSTLQEPQGSLKLNDQGQVMAIEGNDNLLTTFQLSALMPAETQPAATAAPAAPAEGAAPAQ